MSTFAQLEEEMSRMASLVHGGESALPLKECKAARRISTQMLDRLDSTIHWHSSTDGLSQVDQEAGDEIQAVTCSQLSFDPSTLSPLEGTNGETVELSTQEFLQQDVVPMY